MKPRKILRSKETRERFGCGKTAFEENYRFHNLDDPFIPGTKIQRLKPIRLGPRNVGFLEHEVDALIDALAETGGHSESKANNRKAARNAEVHQRKRSGVIGGIPRTGGQRHGTAWSRP